MSDTTPLSSAPDLDALVRKLVLRKGLRDVLKQLQAEARDPTLPPDARAKARSFLVRTLEYALSVLAILKEDGSLADLEKDLPNV